MDIGSIFQEAPQMEPEGGGFLAKLKGLANQSGYGGGEPAQGSGGAFGSGAVGGALDGGTQGAAMGSVIPGYGTAIGGALGTVAGGIMGALGKKNELKQKKEAAQRMAWDKTDQAYQNRLAGEQNAFAALMGV